MMEIDTETYTKTILAVIDSGLIDLVDVELSRGEETMKTIIAAAHRVGVKVVASRHDFTATPDKNIIISNLCLMQSLGADIVKFAVMPQCERDVLTLLDATLTMKEEHSDTPVITMSMSPTGVIPTRRQYYRFFQRRSNHPAVHLQEKRSCTCHAVRLPSCVRHSNHCRSY